MDNKVPVDQQIVDLYFGLRENKRTKHLAWVLGMIATYGVKPDRLKNSYIDTNNNLVVVGRKKPVPPLHPQWVFLFGLNSYCPHKDLESTCQDLYHDMAHNKIQLNITDLLLAHKLRKHTYQKNQKRTLCFV